jgi:hypothetical protein
MFVTWVEYDECDMGEEYRFERSNGRQALSTVLVLPERELRDGVFLADAGEEKVRGTIERVADESVFDGSFLSFGNSSRSFAHTPDSFPRGVGVEFSQSEKRNDKRVLSVGGVYGVR